MKKIRSEIEEIDELFNGFYRGSLVLFMYEPETLGYLLPFYMINKKLEEGYVAILSDESLPLDILKEKLKRYIGIELDKYQREKRLFIIDDYPTLKSFWIKDYEKKDENKMVKRISMGTLDSTYVPKMVNKFDEIKNELPKDKKGIIYLMYDLADFYEAKIYEGEIKGAFVATKILEKLYHDAKPYRENIDLIMVTLDESRVPKEFSSGIKKLADYIIFVRMDNSDNRPKIFTPLRPGVVKEFKIEKYLSRYLFE